MTTSHPTVTALAGAPKTPEKVYAEPHYHATSNDQGYHLRVCVPGVGKSGVSLSLSDDHVLTVTATRSDHVPESWTVIRNELPSLEYQLHLRIDAKIDPERISAKLEDGVLAVTLPTKEAEKPRLIDIE